MKSGEVTGLSREIGLKPEEAGCAGGRRMPLKATIPIALVIILVVGALIAVDLAGGFGQSKHLLTQWVAKHWDYIVAPIGPLLLFVALPIFGLIGRRHEMAEWSL